MKNLSPHRKFLGPPTVKGSMRPFYQHPWPEDLPTPCPVCGTEFRTGWNIEVGPNRIGRILRKAAKFSVLPCLVGAFVLPFLFSPLFGEMLGDWFGLYFLFMLLTAPLLGATSLITPVTRHVLCKKCGWNHDYPPGKPTPIPGKNYSP